MDLLSLYILQPIGHYAKRRWRRGRGAVAAMAIVLRWLAAVGLTAAAYISGRTLDPLVREVGLNVDPFLAVDRFLLLGFSVFFVIQIVRRRMFDVSLRAYKHLPLSMWALSFPFEVLGLLNTPLIAAIGFLVGVDASRPAAGTGIVLWWVAVGSVLVILHFWAALTKHYLSRGRLSRCLLAALPPGLLMLGYADGAGALHGSSLWLSGWLANTSLTAVIVLIIAVSASCAAVVNVRSSRFEAEGGSAVLGRFGLATGGLGGRSGTLRVALLDFLLIRRNAYPRYLMRLMGIMAVLLLPSLLVLDDAAYNLVTVVLVAVLLAATYAQVGFAWHAENFDGLIVLPITEVDHIKGRILVANALIAGSIVLSAPFVAISGFGFPDILIVAHVFAAGCCVLLLLVVSIRWSRRISVNGGVLENAGGYTWHQYVFLFGIWLLVDATVGLTSLKAAVLLLLTAGAAGLALHSTGIRRLSGMLRRDAAQIATRYRTSS